jgi:SAM-dependent methyltransferase
MSSDADAFLLAFHAAHPGATARAFARGRLADDRSTYERLADEADPGARTLDLGCGDGFLLERLRARGHAAADLVGIDLSPEELAAAATRPALAGVRLEPASASALPLPGGAFDVVLSHLAFVLMSDVERVLGEVARVLAPGGRFATIVGGGPGPGDAFERFLDLLADEAVTLPARAPRLGDRRARDAIGLGPLLAAAGFDPPEEEALAVHLGGAADQVWDSLSPAYEVFALPFDRQRRLRERFVAGERARLSDGEQVPCTMRVRLVRARRRGDAGPGAGRC